jgi:hypothetical protein
LIFGADGKLQENCCGEKSEEAPEAVKTAFAALYKDVKGVNWSKEDNVWEAEFEMNEVEMSANFDEAGTLLETESEIAIKDLPVAINTYVTKNLAGAKINEAAKITDAKGVITFEAEIDGADYLFDQKGAFVKKDMEVQETEKKSCCSKK